MNYLQSLNESKPVLSVILGNGRVKYFTINDIKDMFDGDTIAKMYQDANNLPKWMFSSLITSKNKEPWKYIYKILKSVVDGNRTLIDLRSPELIMAHLF